MGQRSAKELTSAQRMTERFHQTQDFSLSTKIIPAAVAQILYSTDNLYLILADVLYVNIIL